MTGRTRNVTGKLNRQVPTAVPSLQVPIDR